MLGSLPNEARPVKICISVDMDNYAEYSRLVDPTGSGEGPTFYDAVPRFLDLFDQYGLKATFFMVGRDASESEHRKRIREIAERGHEVGNHSYTHPYNFRQLDHQQREREIADAEKAIADITGDKPVGFRTPSGDLDTDTLAMLFERGYEYDSSVFPTPVMWAFMLYGKFFIRESNYQLGEWSAIFAPPRPYIPSRDRLHRERKPGDGAPLIVEIPHSVVPGIRVPFYNTLLRLMGRRAFDACVRAYGRQHPELSILMHLIDLVDLEGTSLGRAISDAPGLGIPFWKRQRFAQHLMSTVATLGEPATLREIAGAHRVEVGLA